MSILKNPRYQIEMIGIETLIPYARNSRTHADTQVAQISGSIREFGFTNPVLIDSESSIIAGHGRVLAARKLGLAEVPCIRLAHLTATQKRAYVIADNKLALNAGWDDEVLGLELADLREVDFDLSLTGFDAEKIEAQLNPNGKANDILKEWEDAQMPNYDGAPKGEGGTIIVHFLSQEDRSQFFEKLSITGSSSSKFCWFPHAP